MPTVTTETTTVEESAPEAAALTVVPVVITPASQEGATTALLEMQEKLLRLEQELSEARSNLHSRIDSVEVSAISTPELTEEVVAEEEVTTLIADPIPEAVAKQEPMKTKSWLTGLFLGK